MTTILVTTKTEHLTFKSAEDRAELSRILITDYNEGVFKITSQNTKRDVYIPKREILKIEVE